MTDKLSNLIAKHIGMDGMMHICISALACSLLKLVIPCWIAMLIVLMIGIAKEIYDKVSHKGTPEVKDLFCDIVGIVIGAL